MLIAFSSFSHSARVARTTGLFCTKNRSNNLSRAKQDSHERSQRKSRLFFFRSVVLLLFALQQWPCPANLLLQPDIRVRGESRSYNAWPFFSPFS